MRRAAQPLLSADGQLALEQYTQVLQHLEDFSAISIRNYLSDLNSIDIAATNRSHRTSLCYQKYSASNEVE